MSKELRINRRFESLAAAKEAAVRELHDKNRRTNTANITMLGNPAAAAGLNIIIDGAGKLSGQYHVDSVSHDYSPSGGYTSSLTTRMGAPEAVVPKQVKDATGKKKSVKSKKQAAKKAGKRKPGIKKSKGSGGIGDDGGTYV